uniref:Uncharacterized protein n=1 Tax=Amphora coffeiformis TaxID=265554 RepID=A0A7S3LA50_9STRA
MVFTPRFTFIVFFAACLLQTAAAFYAPAAFRPATTACEHSLKSNKRVAASLLFTSETATMKLNAEGTGGWGLGNSREMVPEEFAKRAGERKAFEGYSLTDRGQFMRKVRQDAQDMRSSELDELMGVAKIAGIKVKDPSERLNKFENDLLNDDEEDLDLSV